MPDSVINDLKLDIRHVSVVETEFGFGCTVVSPVNIYGARIEDNVFIGPFTEIQRGVKIGSRTRIQSHCFICELVTIGADCFIAHGVTFINDRFSNGGPARGDKSRWESTIIGENVSIGSNSTILPVTVCNNVTIGAGSVVTKNITTSGVYFGNPARKVN